MNCKPGDLAIVLSPNPKFAGMLVEVLYAAPGRDFRLPDGHAAVGCRPGNWVLKSLGTPFEARVYFNGVNSVRRTQYGVGDDRYLKPIRPGDLPEETPTEISKPDVVVA